MLFLLPIILSNMNIMKQNIFHQLQLKVLANQRKKKQTQKPNNHVTFEQNKKII